MGRSFVRFLAGGLFAGAFLWITADSANAQQTGTVQGQVTESGTSRVIAGAEVFIDGRARVGLTDEQGRFSITVPVGQVTVRIRSIGFSSAGATMTVTAGQTVTHNFGLTRSAIALDEIVVTGQGREVEQRKLSAPVAVINAEEIRNVAVQDVAQLLQGRVAGATVNATSAQAGTSSLINFRGTSSVFGSQMPVVYVDGIRVDNNTSTSSGTGGEESSAMADILTSDIESIEITKGGAASTLYGSDAASGVIQIFTKRGQPGAPKVNFRMEQGWDAPELKYMFDTGLIYPDEITDGADPDFLKNNYFQTGHFQNYYMNVAGGSSDLTYTVSGRIQQSDGVQPKNGSEVMTLRGAMQADVSNDVTVNFTANYTRTKFGRLFNGAAIADPLTSFEVGDVFFFTGEDNFDDALERFISPDIDETVNRFWFSSGFNYRPSAIFSARGTVGLDYRTNHQREFAPIGAVFINGGDGQLQRFQRDFTLASGDVSATLSWPNEGALLSNFTVGAQGFREDEATTNVTGQTFALPGAPDFDEAATVTAFETNTEIFNGGFYFQEEVEIGDRLFLNGGMRFDVNSAFGDEVDVEAYPKLGAAYLLSDEPILRDAFGSVINDLKLRVAYGKTGKFPTPFLRDRSFSATQFRGESAAQFANPGNEELAPEVTETVEVGFDIAVLSNRVGVGFTYFDAKTVDALFFVPEQPLTGLGTQLRNVGEIQNNGVELDASIQVLNMDDLRWNVGITYHAVKNRVSSLGGEAPFNITDQQRVEEGHQVGAWRVNTPFDSNGDDLNDASERQFTGKGPSPTKSGSFSTSFNIRNALTISASADWATGHEVMDFGSVWATFNSIYRRELIEEGYVFPIRYSLAGDSIGPYSQNQARSAFILKGDWLKLRDITARWELPSSVPARFGFDRAAITFSGRNLKIWSSTPLIDPELNGLSTGGNLNLGGRSSVTLSPSHQFRFGIDVTF